MTEGGGLRWRDAERAVAKLTGSGRRTLLLLARLPFLWVEALQALCGLEDSASLYRLLKRLEEMDLVAAVQPALRPGHSPRLLYLTDLGLATVALDQQVDPASLARCNRLGRRDLLGLLPGLPQLVATYELLVALARSGGGRPNLLAWERPWRRRFSRPTAKAPVTVELPAYAALSWEEARTGAYLLIPDLGSCPLRAYKPALTGLLALRTAWRGDFPTLLIATSDGGRAEGWEYLLESVAGARLEVPFLATVVTWNDLPTGVRQSAAPSAAVEMSAETLVNRVKLPRLVLRQSGRPLPRLVGEALGDPCNCGAGGEPGLVVLGLSPAERELLDLVGRHPFLAAEDLGVILGWTSEWARTLRNRLIRKGLLRLVGVEEVGVQLAKLKLAELTPAGLELVAAQQGLGLSAAVRWNGLTGGGPECPVGLRRSLLRNPEHTLGVNALFAGLYRVASRLAGLGSDDAVLEWRNSTVCTRGRLRPDGYGLYRRQGRRLGFFLEYDRGTTRPRDYLEKLSAYYDYRDSGRFARDYLSFPTILIVTTDRSAEGRLARAAQAAATGREPGLSVLLTTEWRVSRDPSNPEGMLGPIWRAPAEGSESRHRWWDSEPTRSLR